MNKYIKTALTLCLFALVCALMLSVVNYFTKAKIAETKKKQIETSLTELTGYNPSLHILDESISHKEEDKAVVQTYLIKDKTTEDILYAVYIVDDTGYVGTIEMMIALHIDQGEVKVYDYRVISQSETKGNTQTYSLDDGFNMIGEKDLTNFKNLAGSTFSSNAVYRNFNTAIHFAQIDLGGASND